MRSASWKRIRLEVLDHNAQYNRGKCTLAIPGVCTDRATQVHHTLGIQVTGHDPRYVAAVCKACNLHVGDPMAAPDPPVKPKDYW